MSIDPVFRSVAAGVAFLLLTVALTFVNVWPTPFVRVPWPC